MESKRLEIIKKLMEQLQEEMSYGADDFEERLGRKKPGVEVLKLEAESPEEKMEDAGGDDLEECDMEESDGPDAEFKKRLMKLRA